MVRKFKTQSECYLKNPATGRYVLKDGAVGKKIMRAEKLNFIYDGEPIPEYLTRKPNLVMRQPTKAPTYAEVIAIPKKRGKNKIPKGTPEANLHPSKKTKAADTIKRFLKKNVERTKKLEFIYGDKSLIPDYMKKRRL